MAGRGSTPSPPPRSTPSLIHLGQAQHATTATAMLAAKPLPGRPAAHRVSGLPTLPMAGAFSCLSAAWPPPRLPLPAPRRFARLVCIKLIFILDVSHSADVNTRPVPPLPCPSSIRGDCRKQPAATSPFHALPGMIFLSDSADAARLRRKSIFGGSECFVAGGNYAWRKGKQS